MEGREALSWYIRTIDALIDSHLQSLLRIQVISGVSRANGRCIVYRGPDQISCAAVVLMRSQ